MTYILLYANIVSHLTKGLKMKPRRDSTIIDKRYIVDKHQLIEHSNPHVLYSEYIAKQKERSQDRLLLAMCILFVIVLSIIFWGTI